MYAIIGDPSRIGTTDTLAVGLLNLALLQAWVPDLKVFYSYNAVSWSISVEMFFYLLFPIIIIGFRYRAAFWLAGSLLAVALLAITAGAIGAGDYIQGDSSPSLPALMYINPLARLFEFVLGITTAYLWFQSRNWLNHSPMRSTALQVLAIALVMFASSWTQVVAAHAHGLSPGIAEWLAKAGTTSVPSAFLIFTFTAGRGWLARMVSVRPLIWLGEISFALYLVHQIPIHWYNLQGGSASGIPNTTGLFGYLALVLALAAAVHHGVEKPARAWILGRFRQPQRTASTVAS